jgi:hypothetical protein
LRFALLPRQNCQVIRDEKPKLLEDTRDVETSVVAGFNATYNEEGYAVKFYVKVS